MALKGRRTRRRNSGAMKGGISDGGSCGNRRKMGGISDGGSCSRVRRSRRITRNRHRNRR